MLKKITLAVGLATLLGISGCSTVTIHPKTSQKLVNAPSFEESKPFFFWGLAGEHHINVKEICGDKNVKQMQSQQTFANGLLTAITFGIYSPHSVKVWCE